MKPNRNEGIAVMTSFRKIRKSTKTNEKRKQLETYHPTEYALLHIKTIHSNDLDGLAGPGLDQGWAWARPGPWGPELAGACLVLGRDSIGGLSRNLSRTIRK